MDKYVNMQQTAPKYVMLHSFMSTHFAWVDFAVVQTAEGLDVRHVGFYAPGERISQFGERPDKKGFIPNRLDSEVNAVFTAFITPFGVLFRERDMSRPGKYIGSRQIWGPSTQPGTLGGDKLHALVRACSGKWQPNREDDTSSMLWRATPQQAREILQAIKACKISYAGCNPNARLEVVAQVAAMAANATMLPQTGWLELPKQGEKKTHAPKENGLSELERALQQLNGFAKDEEEVEAHESETELPRSSVVEDNPTGNTLTLPLPEEQRKKKRINNPFQD